MPELLQSRVGPQNGKMPQWVLAHSAHCQQDLCDGADTDTCPGASVWPVRVSLHRSSDAQVHSITAILSPTWPAPANSCSEVGVHIGDLQEVWGDVSTSTSVPAQRRRHSHHDCRRWHTPACAHLKKTHTPPKTGRTPHIPKGLLGINTQVPSSIRRQTTPNAAACLA